MNWKNFPESLNCLKECNICPRNCKADRFSGKLGYCKTNAGFNIASICNHKGEEPVISGKDGICNVFFTRCNLQCIYCQNYQISNNKSTEFEYSLSLEQVVNTIIKYLEAGCKAVGFVSPSHNVPQMVAIVEALHQLGYKPLVVYNSNGYDKVETLKELENIVDIYLPDFKYYESQTAKDYSDCTDYPTIALKAIKEMYRQKGSALIVNDEGQAEWGMIIRHLVLPGHVEESKKVLKTIAEEISSSIHLSLMSQYYPIEKVKGHPLLGRTLTSEEYQEVVHEMENLGFYNGWLQELASGKNYQPDFRKEHPFEYNIKG